MFLIAVTFLIYFLTFSIILSTAVKHMIWKLIRKHFPNSVERIETFIDTLAATVSLVVAVVATYYTITAGV